MILPSHPSLRRFYIWTTAASRALASLREAGERLHGLAAPLEALLLFRQDELLAMLLSSLDVDGTLVALVARIEAPLGHLVSERRTRTAWPAWALPERGAPSVAHTPRAALSRPVLWAGLSEPVRAAGVPGDRAQSQSAKPARAQNPPNVSEDIRVVPGSAGASAEGQARGPATVRFTAAQARQYFDGAAERAGVAQAWNQFIVIRENPPAEVIAPPAEPSSASIDSSSPHEGPSGRLEAALERVSHARADRDFREQRGVQRSSPAQPAGQPAAVGRMMPIDSPEVGLETALLTEGPTRPLTGLRALAALARPKLALGGQPPPFRASAGAAFTEDSPCAPQAGAIPPIEPTQLGRRLAEILRREALRHGISPEEWEQ